MSTIHCFNLEHLTHSKYNLFKNFVSESRLKKANSFFFKRDAERCICSELLLLHVIYQKFNQIIDLEIEYNPYGKPALKNINNFKYNISHSGKWVVLATSNEEVGIDIEKKNLIDKKMSQYFLTEKEFIWLNKKYANAKLREKFVQFWTIKESYIKYLGTGFSTDIKSFHIAIEKDSDMILQGNIDHTVNFKTYTLDDHYYLSICELNKKHSIQFVSIEELTLLIQKISHKKRELQ